jgi:hypothetical protein
MKFVVDGEIFHIDLRFVSGLRRTYDKGTKDFYFTCCNGFSGTKRELRTHLLEFHREKFHKNNWEVVK